MFSASNFIGMSEQKVATHLVRGDKNAGTDPWAPSLSKTDSLSKFGFGISCIK